MKFTKKGDANITYLQYRLLLNIEDYVSVKYGNKIGRTISGPAYDY